MGKDKIKEFFLVPQISALSKQVPALLKITFSIKKSNLYVTSIWMSIITILAIHWWFYHMGSTGSALDWYPSRWIKSLPFYSTVFLGSISGGLFISSLLPWVKARYTSLILLCIGVPVLFLNTSYSWFEGYHNLKPGTDHSAIQKTIVTISNAGVIIVEIGWMLSLISAVFYGIYKIVKYKKSKHASLSQKGVQPHK